MFARALATTGAARVKENRSVVFEEWPGIGAIDVALLSNESPEAFIELMRPFSPRPREQFVVICAIYSRAYA